MPYKDRKSITITRERKEELEDYGKKDNETWDHLLGRILRESLASKPEQAEG